MASQRSAEAQPQWLPWLQLGVSTMLVVLFLVMLAKVREQAVNIGSLEQKLKTIEAARSLDRTLAMEQQLEAMIRRLQSLEQLGDQLGKLDGRQQAIERDLQQLRSTPRLAVEGLSPQPSSSGPANALPRATTQSRPSTLPGSTKPSATLLQPPEGNF